MTEPQSSWWRALAPVEVDGPAGIAGHRLRWARGELILTAHPNPDAERVLGALGGERCPCLDVLDAWDGDHGDGAILTVGVRRRHEALAFPERSAREIGADLRRWRGAASSLIEDARAADDLATVERVRATAAPAERAATRRLGFLLLLGLDPQLQLRLQASVAAAFSAKADPSAALAVATAARAIPVLHELGWRGGLDDVRLGGEPALGLETAVLRPDWIAAVWASGLATAVAGHLVLDVTSVTDDGAAQVIAAMPGKHHVAVVVDQWENAMSPPAPAPDAT